MGGITFSSSLCSQLIPLYYGSSVNIHIIYYIIYSFIIFKNDHFKVVIRYPCIFYQATLADSFNVNRFSAVDIIVYFGLNLL